MVVNLPVCQLASFNVTVCSVTQRNSNRAGSGVRRKLERFVVKCFRKVLRNEKA